MTISRRKLLTFLTGGVAGIGATIAALPFIRYLGKAEHIKPPLWAQKIEFPKLQPGQMMTVSSPRNTLYILQRTPEQIAALEQANEELLDPRSEDSRQPEFARSKYRSLRPEIFVAWGTCTHLGCGTTHIHPDDAQIFYQENFREGGGFFCPCHGAIYDSAGRVYKGMPAERNLDIPEYEFIDETTIRITDTKAF